MFNRQLSVTLQCLFSSTLALCSEIGTGFIFDFPFSDLKERRLGMSAAAVDEDGDAGDGLGSEEREEQMLAFSSAAVERLDVDAPLPSEVLRL